MDARRRAEHNGARPRGRSRYGSPAVEAGKAEHTPEPVLGAQPASTSPAVDVGKMSTAPETAPLAAWGFEGLSQHSC
jgi:hypothetical protein